ncbi:type IV fimbrial biogenesis protein FimT [Pseudomonas sp. URMO17WK12:I1]|uniref:GspH/FimT family protein n=1 Tax=unclassified Pseudomonas TaxID=196821 RepID=UPI000480C7C6|nr:MULTISPECIES: GspH/FimT family protein [unclassified Pseudomonas]PZW63812.1 type IV fimbrial biogenesis protein FimT [Pseudomonas sp. URMO17WK12:I1]
MKQNGMTLPELLLGVALVALLMSLLPAFTGMLERHRLENTTRDLAIAIRYARTTAVVEQTGVTIKALEDDWSNGWVIFLDRYRSLTRDDDAPVFTERKLANRVHIQGNGSMSRYIHFSAQGFPKQKSGAFQAGSLVVCSAKVETHSSKLILASGGRLRMSKLKTGCP